MDIAQAAMNVIVLGAGAWGTALAISAARAPQPGRTVTLWARDAALVADMAARRENVRYLPAQALPPSLQLSAEPLALRLAALQPSDLVVVATPMAALRGMLTQLQGVSAPVAWLCKGFESAAQGGHGLMGYEV